MSDEASRTIVIVGGVAGGASAATRARRSNEQARIIMYEKDRDVSFANCGLPYYIGGEIVSRDALLIAGTEHFRRRFNVDVRTRHEVIGIDRAMNTVTVRDLEQGATHEQAYDRLILATGAAPIVPPMEGADAANVFTLRNLQDTDRLKSWLNEHHPRRAVVVGAGFIGLEMVEQLARLGVEVALVELLDQVLPPLDSEMAHVVERELADRGVALHLCDGINALHVRDGVATAVELQSGAVLGAGLVVLGIGVRPNTKLAADTGIDIGPAGGITVNEFMQTSDPHVYAVGDAIEYHHRVLDTPMRVPLGGPANRAGRIAGEHAASDRAPAMAPVTGTAIVRVFEKTAALTGLGVRHAAKAGRAARAVIVTGTHRADYYPGGDSMLLKLVYDPESGAVLGAQAVGGDGVDKRIDVIATAIRFGATVRDLAGVDLAYAPPFGSAKDIVHIAAFAASNEVDGVTRFAQVDEDLSGRQLVDVRTLEEVQRNPLPDAVHIPLDELRGRLDELDPAADTVTVCLSGQRAHAAACILSQSGFKSVMVLTGGMMVRGRRDAESLSLSLGY
ncbi:MAG: NADH oxidase [Phycisphaeraceae bacterium]|nr:NADH oxidase [Phycisphaeraceae bacterium]